MCYNSLKTKLINFEKKMCACFAKYLSYTDVFFYNNWYEQSLYIFKPFVILKKRGQCSRYHDNDLNLSKKVYFSNR